MLFAVKLHLDYYVCTNSMVMSLNKYTWYLAMLCVRIFMCMDTYTLSIVGTTSLKEFANI